MNRLLASPVTRGVLAVALVVALLAAAVLVFNPSDDVPSSVVVRTSDFLAAHGVPGWAASSTLWEFLYNILLFVPVTFAGTLLWPRVPVKAWVVLGFLSSLVIEVAQATQLIGRSSQTRDLVSNTLGALIGAALGRALWSRSHASSDEV